MCVVVVGGCDDSELFGKPFLVDEYNTMHFRRCALGFFFPFGMFVVLCVFLRRIV